VNRQGVSALPKRALHLSNANAQNCPPHTVIPRTFRCNFVSLYQRFHLTTITSLFNRTYLQAHSVLLKDKKEKKNFIWQLGHVVAQFVETLRYKLQGGGFDFRCSHGDFY
jgi:hypothetical protein